MDLTIQLGLESMAGTITGPTHIKHLSEARRYPPKDGLTLLAKKATSYLNVSPRSPMPIRSIQRRATPHGLTGATVHNQCSEAWLAAMALSQSMVPTPTGRMGRIHYVFASRIKISLK